MDIMNFDKTYVANTYARFPVALESGNGSIVKDVDGKEYIDLSTGIAVNSFGFSDPEWVSAVTSQLSKLQHTSNLYYTEPCVKLAKLLCEKTGMKKVFFSNSGAEANECAIKTARKYAEEKKGKEYCNIITLRNSFHGRTVTTLAATGQEVYHNDFTPLTEGFLYADANDIDGLRALVENNKCAAIMMEVIQGEGGVVPLEKEFVKAAEKIAADNDVLLICDEVQTGNGRTGELYGYMNFDITPDIVSTAKGLGGGLPIGATLLGEKVKDVLCAGSHGSTFGGNPVCCAGAISIIERIDDELLKGVKKRSEYIINELSGADGIENVTGIGLMLGVKTKKDVGEVISICRDLGVLIIKAKNKLRLLPALNIPFDQLEKAIDIIKKACAE